MTPPSTLTLPGLTDAAITSLAASLDLTHNPLTEPTQADLAALTTPTVTTAPSATVP